MPITNYVCESCGKKFAKIFFDMKNAPQKCPVCDSDRIRDIGEAFDSDPALFARLNLGSCDSCESCSSCGDHDWKSVRSG